MRRDFAMHFAPLQPQIRESVEVLEPVNDVGGFVPRFNVRPPVAVNPKLSPDPIRYSDFDPQRTRMPHAFSFNPNILQPRIVAEFVSGKVRMEMFASMPRGTHSADWDSDTVRRNRGRPSARSYGTEAPESEGETENLSYWP